MYPLCIKTKKNQEKGGKAKLQIVTNIRYRKLHENKTGRYGAKSHMYPKSFMTRKMQSTWTFQQRCPYFSAADRSKQGKCQEFVGYLVSADGKVKSADGGETKNKGKKLDFHAPFFPLELWYDAKIKVNHGFVWNKMWYHPECDDVDTWKGKWEMQVRQAM